MTTREIRKPRGIETGRVRLTVRVPTQIRPRLDEAADRLGVPLAAFIIMSGLEKADALIAKSAVERASSHWRLRFTRSLDKACRPRKTRAVTAQPAARRGQDGS